MCAFETKGGVKKITDRQQICEQAKKRVEGNNTVQKLAPLWLLSQCPPGFWICCTVALTEQQTGQAPPAFSLPCHRPRLRPSHHWSWRTPALVSPPRGIVTYGNALGIKEMSWSNLKNLRMNIYFSFEYFSPKL